jgi:hypothetical protein
MLEPIVAMIQYARYVCQSIGVRKGSLNPLVFEEWQSFLGQL